MWFKTQEYFLTTYWVGGGGGGGGGEEVGLKFSLLYVFKHCVNMLISDYKLISVEYRASAHHRISAHSTFFTFSPVTLQ